MKIRIDFRPLIRNFAPPVIYSCVVALAWINLELNPNTLTFIAVGILIDGTVILLRKIDERF